MKGKTPKASAEKPATGTLPGRDFKTGMSYPLGATVAAAGANFSLFSRSATGVELLLFDRADEFSPSLRYWVGEMHVDGFRFDLASILARDAGGQVMPNPPVLWDIESDPLLAGTKLIAEAWDAAGLYQVGSFVGDSWREWNGRFRDDARDFFRGTQGSVKRFADRMIGSPEVYGHKEREPEQSVNFVTCHDGFTLNDLVSYNDKHNDANGEEIATARTITGAGIADSKARATIRPWRSSAIAR